MSAQDEGILLDEIDLRILAILQTDGRITNAALAEAVGLSAAPCHRRVRRLERAGIISSYRAVIDPRAVGLGLEAFVEVRVAHHQHDEANDLEAALEEMPEVVACHIVTGDADFLLEVVVADLPHYEEFILGKLLALPMVGDIRSKVVIRRVHSGRPLPLDHLRSQPNRQVFTK
ncbi:MAG: Lrp/AsnC family transcriptional regulator [Actinomycetota bacterium]|nr:Lrp/AsnC family transcriptional regulator [Actinomycetota bacterium]